jgi:hypothetical protein
VPQYDELSPELIYPQVKKYLPSIDDYLPSYKEKYCPSSRFFWNILSTINAGLAEQFIEHAEVQRKNDKKKSESVELTEEVYNMLSQIKVKDKRPKVMTILGNRDITKINRKRKKKYEPLNLEELNEELKEEPNELRMRTKRAKREDTELGAGDMNVDAKTDLMRSHSDLEEEETNALVKNVVAQMPARDNNFL